MTTSNSDKNKISWKKTLLICGIILLAGSVITFIIFSTEPSAQREGATKETAMLVEVTGVERGNFKPTIIATGTVEPAKDIILSPRVSGEIIERSPDFIPGGFVKKGQMLLRIDPADYRNNLKQMESELLQAEADLNIEMGRQDVAQQGYQLLDETLAKENESLVLREPQLNTARARVEAARAAVKQTKLELQRTVIRAPFNAHILDRNVNLGSQVSPGDNLGRLVGRDNYWVVTMVPLSKLRFLSFPENSKSKGLEVKIRNNSAWPEGIYRTGYLYKLVGELGDQTRMARVIVSVPDPLVYKSDTTDLPPLMIGTFVETQIEANELNDIIRLNRDYVRSDTSVWVMRDKKLNIQDVDIVFRDARYAYIKSGLNDNDKIVTTNITTVVDGVKLRLQSDTNSAKKSDKTARIEQDTIHSGGDIPQ